jgi:dipeptidase
MDFAGADGRMGSRPCYHRGEECRDEPIMCDTIVALPSATATGAVLFGKNSDRERNEAQAVEFFPAAAHAPDTSLRCTYIAIPQVPRTHAVLVCRPFWMWGAEMGANDQGVVIGNEAVHGPVPAGQQPALTGMDLLRLGLERGGSAGEALGVIIKLLERHGQGGSCGYLAPRYYNNSFILADRHEAFVLETIGRDWMVSRAASVRSISNAYSIGTAFDRSSTGMSALIAGQPVQSLTDPRHDAASHGRARCERSTALLRNVRGNVRVADMMAILRDHGGHAADWHPQTAAGRTICMHAADPDRGGQTVNSLVSELHNGRAVHWVTGTAAPCLSIFKPVLAASPPPYHGPSPGAVYDPDTLWWRHESMHRAMLARFPEALAAIREERDALEASFRQEIAAVMDDGSSDAQQKSIADCWKQADAAETRWSAAIPAGKLLPTYREAWDEMNRLAELRQA